MVQKSFGNNNEPLTRGEVEVFPDRTPAGSKVEVRPDLEGHLNDDYGEYDDYDN